MTKSQVFDVAWIVVNWGTLVLLLMAHLLPWTAVGHVTGTLSLKAQVPSFRELTLPALACGSLITILTLL